MPHADVRRGAGLLVLLLIAGACLGVAAREVAAQDDDPALAAAEAAFTSAESDEERLAVVREFLTAHPDHPQIAMVIRVGAELMSGPMDDRAGAVELVETQLAAIEDADTRRQVQEILLDLYGDPAYADKLAGLVAAMHGGAELTFVEHLEVIRVAAAAEVWHLVDEHSAAAAPRATAEAFRADYPDREYADEEVAVAGRNRQGLLRTYAGWSAAGQGDAARAFAEFEAAEDLLRKNYFGIPDNELYRYWGRTLAAHDRADEGLEMLVRAWIHGADAAADAAAREVFTELGRDPQDYEDYVWSVRLAHARPVDDFVAADYGGSSHRFDELRGEKATLLAFWFPT